MNLQTLIDDTRNFIYVARLAEEEDPAINAGSFHTRCALEPYPAGYANTGSASGWPQRYLALDAAYALVCSEIGETTGFANLNFEGTKVVSALEPLYEDVKNDDRDILRREVATNLGSQ